MTHLSKYYCRRLILAVTHGPSQHTRNLYLSSYPVQRVHGPEPVESELGTNYLTTKTV